MHTYLLDMLECPACHGALAFDIQERLGDHIERADIRCTVCEAGYPVREGIGLFLMPDLPRHDLWEEVEGALGRYLREHPDIADRLLTSDPHTLSPADRFFRAMALEEHGNYAESAALEAQVAPLLYTAEYNAAVDSQVKNLLAHLAGRRDPVVDLASGRCTLVESLARHLDRVVASDFSPRVLRRDRRYLEHVGLYDRVSLLAFDARCTPFRDASVPVLTTFAGLANVERPGGLLREIRRIASGTFYAISCFYPPEDRPNRELIEHYGLGSLLYRETALQHFAEAGWDVEVTNVRPARALPTPKSTLIPGLGIDALPVAETTLEWCTLVARSRL